MDTGICTPSEEKDSRYLLGWDPFLELQGQGSWPLMFAIWLDTKEWMRTTRMESSPLLYSTISLTFYTAR